MKKTGGVLVLLFFIAGCETGKIMVKKDDFKGTSIVTLKLNISSTENLLKHSRMEAEFIREIGKVGATPMTISSRFIIDPDFKDLEKKAYLKIGDKTHEIFFNNITGEVLTTVEQTEGDVAGAKGFVDFTKEPDTIGINSYSEKIYTGTAALTPQIEQEIKAASEIMLRVYYGTETGTFVIKDNDLALVKKFIDTGAAK